MYTFKNGNLTSLDQNFKYILRYFNFDFWNTEDGFKIHLFDKNYVANDQVDCIIEFYGKTIFITVKNAIDWINEYIKE